MAGSPLDMGKAHGHTFRYQINEAYAEFCHFEKLPEDLPKKWISLFLRRLECEFPDFVSEMRGIATETNLNIEQIAELTLWEELKAASHEINSFGACTSVAFLQTSIGSVVGKTTDIESFQRPYYVLQSITPDNGYRLLSLGKVGSTKAEVGLNEKGLCIATGSTLPLDRRIDFGIERMTLARAALQYCSNVDEALSLISKYNLIRLGLYFLLVDREGKACVVEKSVSHQNVRFPNQRKTIFATNFYLTPKMSPFMDKSAFYYQNALERYINLTVLLETNLINEELEGMQKLLSNHNPLGPICAHFEEIGMCSYYASIMIPNENRFLITDGYPCESEYNSFSL